MWAFGGDLPIEFQNQRINHELKIAAAQLGRSRIGALGNNRIIIIGDDPEIDRAGCGQQVRRDVKVAFMLAGGVCLHRAVLLVRTLHPHAFGGDDDWPGVQIRKHRADHLGGWLFEPISFRLIGAQIPDEPFIHP